MARQADLLDVEVAQQRILDEFQVLPAEECRLADALGRILANDVRSRLDLPPFANSSMDGFALRSEATYVASAASPVELPVAGIIPAGSVAPTSLPDGHALRIMTGAPLPERADAVVPFEEVQERNGKIVISAPVYAGACVRPRGNDIVSGISVLPARHEITPRSIGLLAALGQSTVEVVRRPIVAILSTGDELVTPGETLGHGQIYNSNTPMLAASVTEAGAIPRIATPSRDDPEAIAEALERASDTDLILTSGGASVGDFDHVRAVVETHGSLTFWRVRVRPGKPLLFGRVNEVPVIGLPGNPTSAMVTFELFVRPALRTLLGSSLFRPRIDAVLTEGVNNRGGRRTYARVNLSYEGGAYRASLAGGQDSAMLLPLAHADGLAVLPETREFLEAGESVAVLVWKLPQGTRSG